MDKIQGATATRDWKFTKGITITGSDGTIVSAEWLNNVQEEICNVISAEKIQLDESNVHQLNTAINKKIDTLKSNTQVQLSGLSTELEKWKTKINNTILTLAKEQELKNLKVSTDEYKNHTHPAYEKTISYFKNYKLIDFSKKFFISDNLVSNSDFFSKNCILIKSINSDNIIRFIYPGIYFFSIRILSCKVEKLEDFKINISIIKNGITRYFLLYNLSNQNLVTTLIKIDRNIEIHLKILSNQKLHVVYELSKISDI